MSTTQSGKGGGRQLSQTYVTADEIRVELSDEAKQQAQECLRRTGSIKITFREISVTQLPARLDNGEQID